MWQEAVWLLAIDDFVLADYGIPPAVLTNQSSQLGYGITRREGINSSIYFGSTPVPATWNALFACPDEWSRQALMSIFGANEKREFRLLGQRDRFGGELIVTEAAISGELEERSRGTFFVNFESNDSVWLADWVEGHTKTFASPLDQVMNLPVPGNVPTNPVIRVTPLGQRSVTTPYVGWSKRQRFAISNEGTDPFFRYEVMIDLGDTAALVTAGKARADGADLRVWLYGIEQSRSLVGWNTTATKLWVIVPVLPPRQSLTYDVVYGNPLATADDGVDLVYPELPAHDIDAGTNFVHVYRTAKAIAFAARGLWHLTSPLEGGSADYGTPGSWQPALTYENPNNTDNYVQPRSLRVNSGQAEWYQAMPFAVRWKGDGWDEDFEQYAGSDPFDGVVLYNPLGIRSVSAENIRYKNNAKEKKVVTTTVGDPGDETTESSEVLVPRDPPFTRAVIIGRSTGGEGWHVLQEYADTTIEEAEDVATPVAIHRLYLPWTGSPSVFPAFASGWEENAADRVLAKSTRGTTPLDARDYTITSGGSANKDYILRQYVYPLPAGVQFTTTDTVKGRGLAMTTSLVADIHAQMCIRVMTATSVVRATLLNFDAAALSEEFGTNIAFTARNFPRGGEQNLQANYTTVAGDYLVMEYGFRRVTPSHPDSVYVALAFGDKQYQFTVPDLPEGVDTKTSNDGAPWIEFSTDLAGGTVISASLGEVESASWTPPSPLKHFGIAAWPNGVTSIPDDTEGRTSFEIGSDITVYLAAESLLVTQIEEETDIYELATEFRVLGGANAIGPYHALLVGNARQGSGPGTPRAALRVDDEALEIDTEQRTHTVWDADFTVQHEKLSTHAVRALSGALRKVDATDIPAMMRTPVEVPNNDFASSTSGWEPHSGGSGWSVTVTHDPNVGGKANGSLRFNVTSSAAGTLLYHDEDAFPVNAGDHVEVTAWMRQQEAGSSSPRLGVAWYDEDDVLLSTTLDAFFGILLNPSEDRTMTAVAAVPSGATQARIVLGLTVTTDVPATKWFDDLTFTTFTPVRYDASLAKVTEEMRASRWLPLIPPRRTVINGAFDVDIAGWEKYADGVGVTHAVTHDPDVGGYQDGSLAFTITANSGNNPFVYLSTQPFPINGAESETLAAWVRTTHITLVPLLCIAWYHDLEAAPLSIATEALWQPAAMTGYRRAFGAIAPPGAKWFRLGIAVHPSGGATGTAWVDDITLNDNDLFVADVQPASLAVAVDVRPRYIP